MIIRSVTRCSALRNARVYRPGSFPLKKMKYSTSTSSISTSSGSSQASVLCAFTSELDKFAPRFDIQGSQIQILRSPADFYETLKVRDINCHS